MICVKWVQLEQKLTILPFNHDQTHTHMLNAVCVSTGGTRVIEQFVGVRAELDALRSCYQSSHWTGGGASVYLQQTGWREVCDDIKNSEILLQFKYLFSMWICVKL